MLTYIFAFLGGIGVPELLLIGVIVLVMFGGKKIPEMLRGLGTGIKEFKNAQKEPTEIDDNKEKTI